MQHRLKIPHYPFFLSAITWLLLDLATKFWAGNLLSGKIVFIENWLFLTKETNTGIAFSIAMPRFIQIVGSLIIIVILFYLAFFYLFKQKEKLLLKELLFGMVIGGALGNLIDRISTGYVVDLISLKPFPVFNVADIGITIGLIALFLITLRK